MKSSKPSRSEKADAARFRWLIETQGADFRDCTAYGKFDERIDDIIIYENDRWCGDVGYTGDRLVAVIDKNMMRYPKKEVDGNHCGECASFECGPKGQMYRPNICKKHGTRPEICNHTIIYWELHEEAYIHCTMAGMESEQASRKAHCYAVEHTHETYLEQFRNV